MKCSNTFEESVPRLSLSLRVLGTRRSLPTHLRRPCHLLRSEGLLVASLGIQGSQAAPLVLLLAVLKVMADLERLGSRRSLRIHRHRRSCPAPMEALLPAVAADRDSSDLQYWRLLPEPRATAPAYLLPLATPEA